MKISDRIRLQHIRDAAAEALSFTSGRDVGDLIEDRMLALSLIKELEIIGEAAGKISEETRIAFPSIPWIDIIGMRNRLIHGYYDLDIDLIWDTVTIDLPDLLVEIYHALDSE